MAAMARLLLAAVLLISLPGVARSDHLNRPEADWFIVILTAGPDGARGVEATFSTNGRTTGEPMVSGIAIGDGESGGGGVSSSFGPGLRVGSAGAAQARADILPPGGAGTYGSNSWISSDLMEPGEQVAFLVFTSGTLSRPSPIVTKSESGSVSAEMVSGTGSKAILLLDTADGVAAELAVAGVAVDASYSVDSPGLFGGFTGCVTCLGEWASPDGRHGDNQTSLGAFAGPAGRWTLDWNGATHPAIGWATVGGYAPIGDHWKYFNIGPGLLG